MAARDPRCPLVRSFSPKTADLSGAPSTGCPLIRCSRLLRGAGLRSRPTRRMRRGIAQPARSTAGGPPRRRSLASVVCASARRDRATPTRFGLSAYVPLVGGTAPEGQILGLNRQFWGYTTQNGCGGVSEPETHRQARASFIHDTDVGRLEPQMQEEGRIRRDLRAVGTPHRSPDRARAARGSHERSRLLDMGGAGTISRARLRRPATDGVPIVSVYRKDGPRSQERCPEKRRKAASDRNP